MKKSLLVLVALLVLGVGSAMADSVTIGPGDPCGAAGNDCGPFSFEITTDGTTASLTVTYVGPDTGNTWTLSYFTLNLFTNDITASGDLTQNGGITITNDTQGNNGNNGGAGGCNKNGPNSAFCVVVTNGYVLDFGDSVTFNFDIDGGTLKDIDDWHLQAVLLEDGEGQGRVALSTTPGGGNEVPEPASMALLGTGMLGAGTFLRRKLGL